ncbi:MAG: tRNA (adenosine(37)-N6)-threonylcarbamoyltransferase complex dimerization subunit type 1 TsaB [bacterium]|nr:tRNA (adenosine(37)-N6)-threonylcarbamoyltransferase complex dimerization subunit type 1 TsaB [bacterium]
MKILGIDSSGLVAGVAVVEDDRLVGEYTTDYKKTHSQTLLPMLDELKKMIELELDSIDAIAVASGPGSFTGLRIGSATAKGLGLALKKPLVEVPTLEGLAWNLWGTESLVCPMMDARRNQVYTAVYEFVPEGEGFALKSVVPQSPREIGDILETVNKLGRQVIFLGDGVPVYLPQIRELIRVEYRVAPAGCNRQRAACIAALGAVYYSCGRTVEADLHQPEYLRKSQAEREQDERAREGR